MQMQAPRGTVDLIGDDIVLWNFITDTIKRVCENYRINEIKTPIFEHTEVFKRDENDTSDVVNKEMYTFKDKGDRSLTLKPEGTAGVVRAFVEHKMYVESMPQKLYYVSPHFRYERPQAGRQRQFHQFGVEYFNVPSVNADAEVISLAYNLLKEFKIDDVELHINSLGDVECRNNYNDMLKQYLASHKEQLCETCQDRYEKNPLRTFDCKNKSCQEVLKDSPTVLETLGDGCKSEFEQLKKLLDNIGIKYVVDERLVRGLDYYTKTVFEFISNGIGAQGTVCGGGRYDKLVEQFGATPTTAVGFGMGIERIMLVIKANGNVKLEPPKTDLYIGCIGEGVALAQKLAFELRCKGLNVECNIVDKGVKPQMKYANKINASYVVIVGDDEVATGTVNIKNMEDGSQEQVSVNDIADFMGKNKNIEL